MMQGDAYSVPVVIKAKDGTVITPEMATRVEITIGHLTRQWPGVITFNEDTLAWEFPLTQQQSFRLSQGKQKTQVRVAFSNGWVVGGDGTDVRVLKSESKSILPAAAQQEKAANIAFGAIFAEIGAITVVLGAGLPEMSSATKGQYLTNDGETAEWANVDALPTMSSDTVGKMLTNDGEKAEWGGAVRYDAKQNLSNDSKTQARENIGLTPVVKTDDMTQSVGYDAETGELYTTPAAGGGSLPVASPTQLGGVKPVAKTDAMTRSIGVDGNGGLYVEPSAWYVTVTKTSASSTEATADKTPQEVFEAYRAGYAVYARANIVNMGNYIMPLLAAQDFGDDDILLGFAIIGQASLESPVTLLTLISINNTWSVEGVQLAKKTDLPSIPTVLPNPNALTFTGAVSDSYDGSEAKTVNIPTVPTALKNPNALTITIGDNVVSYDGSETRAITIPTGGSSGGETWELINTFEIAGADAARVIKIDKDSNGNAFSLKEFAFSAKTNSTKTDGNVYGWFCVNGKGNYNSGVGGFQANYVRHPSTGAAIYNDVVGRVLPCGLIYDTTTNDAGTNGVITRSIADVHEVEFAGYGYDDNHLYGTFSLWGVRK